MKRKRRRHSVEFKQETVRLVLEKGLNFAQAGKEAGVDSSLVRDWVRKSEAGELEPAKGQSQAELEAEVRRLRRENARLKEEQEILKKAAVFFAKESR